jgi:hypothetical protein
MVISLVHTSLGLSYLIAHVLHYLSSSPHSHSFVYGTQPGHRPAQPRASAHSGRLHPKGASPQPLHLVLLRSLVLGSWYLRAGDPAPGCVGSALAQCPDAALPDTAHRRRHRTRDSDTAHRRRHRTDTTRTRCRSMLRRWCAAAPCPMPLSNHAKGSKKATSQLNFPFYYNQ